MSASSANRLEAAREIFLGAGLDELREDISSTRAAFLEESTMHRSMVCVSPILLVTNASAKSPLRMPGGREITRNSKRTMCAGLKLSAAVALVRRRQERHVGEHHRATEL